MVQNQEQKATKRVMIESINSTDKQVFILLKNRTSLMQEGICNLERFSKGFVCSDNEHDCYNVIKDKCLLVLYTL